MALTRRIYVSMPADTGLTREQNDMKWGIVERIDQLGYTPEIFTDPTGRKSLSSGLALSAADADEIARHCHGAAIIGLPRWVFKAEDRTVYLPTEYCQYEGAIARTLGLPLLIRAQAKLMRRVVFDSVFGPYIDTFPDGADRSWLGTNEFQACFTQWRARLENRRDVFLGYCGSSSGPADKSANISGARDRSNSPRFGNAISCRDVASSKKSKRREGDARRESSSSPKMTRFVKRAAVNRPPPETTLSSKPGTLRAQKARSAS